MNKLIPLICLAFLTSCFPSLKKDFMEWEKECQAYREKNGDKKLIPYLDDVVHGKD